MKRPPDRKLVLAAMVLLVAASAVFARPGVNVADNGDSPMRLVINPLKGGR